MVVVVLRPSGGGVQRVVMRQTAGKWFGAG